MFVILSEAKDLYIVCTGNLETGDLRRFLFP